MRAEPRRRARVAPLPVEAASAILCPPRLPLAAAGRVALARRAAAAGVPVLLEAPAPGRLLLARALHALGGRAGPLVATVGRRPDLDALPADGTLLVDAGALAPETALALEALLDDRSPWVIAAVRPGTMLPPALATPLAAVVLRVPPLGERPGDVPELAAVLLAAHAARVGRPALRLAPAAVERLAAHPWPGDVPELDAALARAALVADDDVVTADALALGPDPETTLRAPAAPPGAADGGAALEFLLAELAHELRNPLVTIQTFARHLPAMLDDAALRDRFASLTDEAIARMDGLLENVLTFARLGAPHPETVEMGPLLDRVLADMEPELAGRAVRVRQAAAPSARYAADPEQLAFALRNLFAGVVREVPAREELLLDAAANGMVTLRFAAGAEAADRLRRLAAPTDAPSLADPTFFPLVFRLARAVLERNGGALRVVPEGGGATTLVLRLPTPAAAADTMTTTR
jgi:signal transduction histidine kinase